MPYIAFYFKAFYKYYSSIIFEKMRGYPQFSFWISIALVKIYISCIIINWAKIPLNNSLLVGTVHKHTPIEEVTV